MKLRISIIASLCLLAMMAKAQRPAADKIKTNKGDLSIQPILHGTLMLQWDGKTIYIDPYGGAKAFAGLPDPDLILITDIHGDHLNKNTLKEINLSKAYFVVPEAVKKQMDDIEVNKSITLDNGASNTVHGIGIRAVPMYNLPEDESSRHTKGRGNGYVLTFGDKTVYISGDTEDIPEMRDLKDIDVAFVCMNLPYTMDINQAASAVLDFKPVIMYPFHYRGTGGLADVQAFKKLVQDGFGDLEVRQTEVRLRNWYPEY